MGIVLDARFDCFPMEIVLIRSEFQFVLFVSCFRETERELDL